MMRRILSRGTKYNKRMRGAAGLLTLSLAISAVATGGIKAFATEPTDDESTETIESSLIKDRFGSVTMYRWEKVTGSVGDLQETFAEWTPVMMIANGSYISGVPRNCLYGSGIWGSDPNKAVYEALGGSSPETSYVGYTSFDKLEEIKGKDWMDKYIRKSTIQWGKTHVDPNINLVIRDDSGSTLIQSEDRAFNYASKDVFIKADRDVFYTDDDRDVPSIRYRKYTDTNARGFSVRMKRPANGDEYFFSFVLTGRWASDTKYEYTAGSFNVATYGSGENFYGAGLGSNEEISPTWTLTKGSGNTYKYGRIEHDPEGEMSLVTTEDITYGEVGAATYYTMFLGTEHQFSTLKGDTVIGDGQILSVSEADYIKASGAEETDGKGSHTMGCFIPNGATITVNKGGVLSISGNLINNGTIINNGGVILIQNGGSISTFLGGTDIAHNGCGTLKCNGGDIIIENGGALYAGMNDAKGYQVPFYLDNHSTLINCGLLVYGAMKAGTGSRVEMRSGSKTIGECYSAKFVTKENNIYNIAARLDMQSSMNRARDAIETLYWDTSKYRVSYRESTVFEKAYWEVYEKVTTVTIDGDYDILSYYNDTITKAKKGIPSTCLGLYRTEGIGGMYLEGSSAPNNLLTTAVTEDYSTEKTKYEAMTSGKPTILKYAGASFEDSRGANFVQDKSSL